MDAVEEIKSRLGVEEVVAQYVELKRSGSNLKGLSPFTNEKTPSFVVSPQKQIWHDFSSGKGGNMFSFIMEMEGVDFKGALEILARKAGVELSQYGNLGNKDIARKKETLLEILEVATKFYQVQLRNNQEILKYVIKKRQFNKETVLLFRLGYSPSNGSALINYLTKKGYKTEDIKSAGLAVQYSGRRVDMFRGRLMVPLMDGFGKVVGFTARILSDDQNSPKYINTPQTILYDKGRHVFGYHLAKDEIRKSKFAVLVEGNLDVIASHQAGITNVVATAGTALTKMQLKNLSRLAEDIRLAFDEDRAGQDATERAIPISAELGLSLNIIAIPSGKDPDDLIKKDPKIWEKIIDKPIPAVDWLIKRYTKQVDMSQASGKRKLSDVVMKVVAELPDRVEQDHYLKYLADLLGVTQEALRSKMKLKKPTVLKRAVVSASEHKRDDLVKDTDHLLAIALMLMGARIYLQDLTAEMLYADQAKELLVFLNAHPDFSGDLKKAKQLQKNADYVKILSVQFEELYGKVDTLELHYEAARLRTRIIENYVKFEKSKLVTKLNDANEAESKKILQQVKELDQLLKKTKEVGHYA